MAILNLKITATANDVGVTGGALDVGDTRVSSTVYGALRFLNVIVPNSASITSATLRLHSEGGAHSVVGTVKGVLGNCPAWSTSPLPGALSQTSASASLPTSTSVAWVERDITAIVQEIVNGTWASGNALGVILGYTSGSGTSFYTDYTSTSADAAELIIDYATAPAITSATSIRVLHGVPVSFALTSDQSVDWSIYDGDAGDWTLTGNILSYSGGNPNFDAPTDANSDNVYSFSVAASNPVTGLSASATQTITVEKLIYVGGQTYGRAGATGTATQNFVLTNGTNSAPQAGDLVLIAMHVGATSDLTLALTSGYTKVNETYVDGTSYDSNMALFYKFMGSTPDTNFTVGSSGAIENAQNCYISVWRGIDPTTPFDLTPVFTPFTGTAKPNPPSVTPVTNGAVMVMISGVAAATTANWTAPAYLTDFRTISTADTVDSAIGGGYRRWLTADGAYDGAVWAGGGTATSVNATTNIVAVLRPATSGGGGTQNLTASLYTNSQTFYGPTVTRGALSLAPPLYTNANSFFAATVSQVQSLLPPLLTNTQSFFAPSVSVGAVALTPALYSNTQTFYAATVTRGAISLAPALLTNSQSFYAPTISAIYRLTPAQLTTAQTFYTATVARGSVALTASLLTNAQTFYSPAVTSRNTLTPAILTNSQAFYGPTVVRATITLTPARYDNSQTFYAATVAQSNVVILPPLVANAQSFFSPTVKPRNTLTATRLTNAQTFYGPVVGASNRLTPPLYANDNQFFSAVLTQGDANLRPDIFVNDNVFFAAEVFRGIRVHGPARSDDLTITGATRSDNRTITGPARNGATTITGAARSDDMTINGPARDNSVQVAA